MSGRQEVTVSVSGGFGTAQVQLDIRGSGPDAVYVHGWSCSRHDFDGVADLLAATNRIVSVDLPYHGASQSSNARLTMADLGAVLVGVVDQLRLEDVALVGHSMGSAVAVEAAGVLGSAARRVVAVDGLTYLGVYPRQDEETVSAVLDSFSTDFPEAIRGFVDVYTPGAPQALKDSIASVMLTRDPSLVIPLLGSLLRWDLDAALDACGVPISVVASSTFLEPDAVARYGTRLEILPADLGGHFFFMEDPVASAPLLAPLLAG